MVCIGLHQMSRYVNSRYIYPLLIIWKPFSVLSIESVSQNAYSKDYICYTPSFSQLTALDSMQRRWLRRLRPRRWPPPTPTSSPPRPSSSSGQFYCQSWWGDLSKTKTKKAPLWGHTLLQIWCYSMGLAYECQCCLYSVNLELFFNPPFFDCQACPSISVRYNGGLLAKRLLHLE